MLRSILRGGAAAVIVVGLAWPAAARAEAMAVTSETAHSLTDTLDIGLRQWLPPEGGKAGWHWAGRPLVTPAGDHFDVDLPALTISGDDGDKIQAGVIKLTLAPLPDGSWQVGGTLPSQMLMLKADGKTDGEMTIGSQSFSGRWVPSLNTFAKVEAALGNLRAFSAKDSTKLEIASLAILSDLSEQPPGRWSGPGSLTLKGMTMVDDHGLEVARIGSIAVESTVSGLDLAKMVKAGGSVDPEHHPDLLRNLIGSFTAKLTIGDTTLNAGSDGGLFSVKEVVAHGGVEGLDGEHSSIGFGYRHAGLSLEPSPGPREFTPEKAEMDLAIVSLPNAGLWSAVEALLKPDPKLSDDQRGNQFSQAVLEALTQAGSRLEVKALSLDTPAAAATLKGAATFDSKAALGMVAGVDMVLRGLDAAMKEMQPAPGAKPDEEAQKTLATLSLVQAMGAPGKDGSGRDLRSYKFELASDGKILLNGADMSVLLQGIQGQSEPEPTGKAPKSKH